MVAAVLSHARSNTSRPPSSRSKGGGSSAVRACFRPCVTARADANAARGAYVIHRRRGYVSAIMYRKASWQAGLTLSDCHGGDAVLNVARNADVAS